MKQIFNLSKNQKLKIKTKLKKLLETKKEIIFTYIHGSFLLDSPFHDIDLAVFINESHINDFNALDYEIQLSIELELEIKIPIDIKIINFAPLSFQYNITKGKILFSKNDELRYNFIETTWMKYLEFKSHFFNSFKYLYNIK